MISRQLRVAVVGLGDIARKAYLPVLAAMPGLELHLVTRDARALKELGDTYRIADRHGDPEPAIAAGLDAAFVHAATSAHPVLVELFLRAGVPVYVDKPLASDLATCERLVRLAESGGCSLMVGFNRRHAPLYAELAGRPRDIIVMQKNRARSPDAARRVAYDDFIHVADTLRFLFPGVVRRTEIDVRMVGDELHHIAVKLSGGDELEGGQVAIGIMNRMSGADEETLEVMGGGAKRSIVDLAQAVDQGPARAVTRRPDWRTATWMRGIDQICDWFLRAVRDGETLCARDALASHALCEAVVAKAEASGVRSGPLE